MTLYSTLLRQYFPHNLNAALSRRAPSLGEPSPEGRIQPAWHPDRRQCPAVCPR